MIWFRRRLNRRRWRARQRARARDKHIKSPNENSTSKNIPQKKKRDVFKLIIPIDITPAKDAAANANAAYGDCFVSSSGYPFSVDILYSEGIFIEVGKTVRNSWCPVLHTKGLQNDVDFILFREEFEEKRGRVHI